MAASIAAATQAEATAESLRRDCEQPTTGLAQVIASIKWPAAVTARLLGRTLHDRRVDRHQSLKKLAR